MDDELYTDDLNIVSAQTRSQLAALLRTIHLRADKPSLRTLEARTRHDSTPLSKTAVSEMLKGTRFPRKAVMISFLRTCGVPEDRMELWRRAWERVAASEHDLSGPAVYQPTADQDQAARSEPHATWPAAPGRADDKEVSVVRPDARTGMTAALAAFGAERPHDLADQPAPGRAMPSPVIRRRELGTLLRALRVSAEMTIEEVAGRLLCSPSKVSRMETGYRSVALRDVRDLCDLYQVDDVQRDHLMELSREGRRQGWWESFDLPFATFIGLEADASSIDIYHAAIIPGLLQTEDYARAIIESTATEYNRELTEKGLTVRLTRQRLLTQEDPPQLHVIMDEAALRRVIGGPAVMKAQLDHLVEKSSLPNVTIQIIPYDSGAHPALDSSFTILELPSPMPGVIYVEGLFGLIYLERHQEVERYQQIFRELQSIAVTEQESIAFIAKASRDLNHSP